MTTSRQAAANCDRFEALTVGSRFITISAGRSPSGAIVALYTREAYTKTGADTIQASDGREWAFAMTEASGAGVALVPAGARTALPYFTR
jgi:hypothetical protein